MIKWITKESVANRVDKELVLKTNQNDFQPNEINLN